MIATNHPVLMFLVEAALGVIGAIVITFALMAALFTWDGQPGQPASRGRRLAGAHPARRCDRGVARSPSLPCRALQPLTRPGALRPNPPGRDLTWRPPLFCLLPVGLR